MGGMMSYPAMWWWPGEVEVETGGEEVARSADLTSGTGRDMGGGGGYIPGE